MEQQGTQENTVLQQFPQEKGDAITSTQLESARFDSWGTPIPDVNLRTDKGVLPDILMSHHRNLLTLLVERGRRVAHLDREVKQLQAQKELLGDDLKALAAGRTDFRGFEFIGEEKAVLNIFPVYQFDADKLHASLGNENFAAVTHDDTLLLRVNIDGHPEARHILEDAFRRSVRTTLRLKEDDEVNARVEVIRSTTVRRPELKELLKTTGKRLLAGTVKKPQWHLVVLPSRKEGN